jgi:predicted ferric reductase
MTPKRPGYAIVYLTLVMTAILFLLSKPSLSVLGANVFVTLAQISALLGVVLFAFSFIVATRTYLVEEAFGGVDRAYRFHHTIGVWSFSLLVVHMASVLVGYGINGAPIVALLTHNSAFILGEIGLFAMAAIILTIVYAKIRYQNFVLIQKFLAIPYAFGIYHLLIVTSDVSRYAPLRIFMIAAVSLGALAWINREFLYRRFATQAVYVVKEVKDMGANIVGISLAPKKDRLAFKPGQFAYFSLRSKTVSSEPHPFSFSSAPESDELRFASKRSGDFTNELDKVAIGDEAAVFGPYGKFFSGLDPDAENVFIAGGIGATPFLSLVRSKIKLPKTVFFYCTNSALDAVFDAELKKISATPDSFRYFLHESDRRGHINADVVEKHANGIKEKQFYLCGPAMMMENISDGLIRKGVPRRDIHFESFSYRPRHR